MEAISRPRPARYRLYIDESGDHNYKQLDQSSYRYLALLGVWFRQADDYTVFRAEWEQFKVSIFGERPDPVLLHRKEIINRKGPFGILQQPEIRARFDEGLLAVVRRAQFRMICVVVDKLNHSEKYTSPFHPYHYCMAAILDRYSGWLNYKNAVGDVVAESRGRQEDLQLKEAYTRVYSSGTLQFGQEHYQHALTSKDIKLQAKTATVAGLELADLLAYPVKQSYLNERGRIPDSGGAFGKRIVEVAQEKFNRHESRGTVDGYGKIWL